eukprot:CAMPEP_0203013280 /NCGR_PEP_ID=MMETSP1401-20130829/14956_1 /ASSEMBLY_ACC=CAM_ASM_000894 /TAXON_ID=38833 /ORGANISM="Micromonas pusilla, Strain CCAC1681" /LENGTH=682 /DNA_ID=CAMNT_0049754985 /DNA_START=1 /DNA_END=2046 /DNA_ORIENTATION=-
MGAPSDAGVHLRWRDVTYTVTRKATKKPTDASSDADAPNVEVKTILSHISGETEGGSLLALMGPSGSGKTSLLNALAFRVPRGPGAEITGTVLADGRLVETPGQMARMSAYVEQEDALFALSTVRETLMFAAQLRLGPDVPLEEKKRAVELVIADLGLVAAADTCVGNEVIRGISGGERKRVAIGMDLLHDPKLIFMDEPTSGLDAFQALNVMTTLKHLARDKGRTVVASVHQPRSSIYALVDQLVLLSGGRLMYAGDGGSKCSAHFASLGAPVPTDFNPADHFLDAISVDFRSPTLEQETRARIETLYEGFHRRDASRASTTSALAVSSETKPLSGLGRPEREDGPASRARSQFWVPFKLLLFRTWREQTRDVATLTVKYVMNTFFCLLFGVVYLRMKRDQISIQDRTGILFFQAMNQAFGSAIGISKIIPQQLKVVSRERAARMYTPLPYFLSTFLVTLPLELFPGIIYGTVLYFMTALREGVTHYLVYIGVMLLENFAGIGLGMCLSASFNSVEMAPQLAPAFVILFLMFSGFFLNESNVPVFLIWLRELSFIRYAFQALCVNEFKGAEFSCDPSTTATCIDGDEHLDRLKFDDVKIWENCLILFGMIVGFNALALAIIYYRQPKYLALGERRSASDEGDRVEAKSANEVTPVTDGSEAVNGDAPLRRRKRRRGGKRNV